MGQVNIGSSDVCDGFDKAVLASITASAAVRSDREDASRRLDGGVVKWADGMDRMEASGMMLDR